MELIKMYRESDDKFADVHPDMVEEYKKGDFVVVAKPKSVPKKAASSKKGA